MIFMTITSIILYTVFLLFIGAMVGAWVAGVGRE